MAHLVSQSLRHTVVQDNGEELWGSALMFDNKAHQLFQLASSYVFSLLPLCDSFKDPKLADSKLNPRKNGNKLRLIHGTAHLGSFWSAIQLSTARGSTSRKHHARSVSTQPLLLYTVILAAWSVGQGPETRPRRVFVLICHKSCLLKETSLGSGHGLLASAAMCSHRPSLC